jgi:hypothetical protein
VARKQDFSWWKSVTKGLISLAESALGIFIPALLLWMFDRLDSPGEWQVLGVPAQYAAIFVFIVGILRNFIKQNFFKKNVR